MEAPDQKPGVFTQKPSQCRGVISLTYCVWCNTLYEYGSTVDTNVELTLTDITFPLLNSDTFKSNLL